MRFYFFFFYDNNQRIKRDWDPCERLSDVISLIPRLLISFKSTAFGFSHTRQLTIFCLPLIRYFYYTSKNKNFRLSKSGSVAFSVLCVWEQSHLRHTPIKHLRRPTPLLYTTVLLCRIGRSYQQVNTRRVSRKRLLPSRQVIHSRTKKVTWLGSFSLTGDCVCVVRIHRSIIQHANQMKIVYR